MKKLIIIIFYTITYCFSQTLDDAIKGPIPGMTYTSESGKFNINANFISYSIESTFDDNGDEISISDQMFLEFEDGSTISNPGIAYPEILINRLIVNGSYTLTEKWGLSVGIPILTKQELNTNVAPGHEVQFDQPGYMKSYYSGQTGIGDIAIGGWYQISNNQNIRTLAATSYTLSTGTSPDDLSESDYSSTGSGHTSINFGINTDYFKAPYILLSSYGYYIINQKGEFSSDGISLEDKHGNKIGCNGRVSILASPQLSLAMDINYLSAGTSKLNGETIDNSDYNYFSLAPLVGYQIIIGSTRVNLIGSFPLISISGKNYGKLSGFGINAGIYF